MTQKFFITTPIYYINDRPHIGHAYATIAADVLARYHREKGEEVRFLTGVDENAQKTVEAAEKAGSADVKAYADKMAKIWQDTWSSLGISHDRFVRTTSSEHKKAVVEFIKKVQETGDIYEGEYEGLYCTGCEEFKNSDDLVDGLCPIHKVEPKAYKEKNYFFKLSRYQKPLLDHIKAHPEFVQPASRRNEVVAFIERGLEDISISRRSQKWGVPFPGDDEQVVYVWFDALINYLSGVDYPEQNFSKWWPADVHLVGKDIIKFHCMIWPAMLLSAGLSLPQTVYAHGFFTIDGQKISKSLGNAIDPLKLAEEYGNDSLRYYLLRAIPFGGDGEFTHEHFTEVYNADLANELGNLVSRTAAMITKYQAGVAGDLPSFSHDVTNYDAAMSEIRFDRALEEVWVLIKGMNQLIEEEKPWELAKTDQGHLTEVLAHLVTDLLQVARLLLPFMPEAAGKIARTFKDGKVDGSVGMLFPKKEFTIKNIE